MQGSCKENLTHTHTHTSSKYKVQKHTAEVNAFAQGVQQKRAAKEQQAVSGCRIAYSPLNRALNLKSKPVCIFKRCTFKGVEKIESVIVILKIKPITKNSFQAKLI